MMQPIWGLKWLDLTNLRWLLSNDFLKFSVSYMDYILILQEDLLPADSLWLALSAVLTWIPRMKNRASFGKWHFELDHTRRLSTIQEWAILTLLSVKHTRQSSCDLFVFLRSLNAVIKKQHRSCQINLLTSSEYDNVLMNMKQLYLVSWQ